MIDTTPKMTTRQEISINYDLFLLLQVNLSKAPFPSNERSPTYGSCTSRTHVIQGPIIPVSPIILNVPD
jgi:hypothetical protein